MENILELKIKENVRLAPLTTFNIGGKAKFFINIQTNDKLIQAIEWAKQQKVPHYILGGGSNTLFADSGIDGLVIHVNTHGIERSGEWIKVQAGEDLDNLVAFAVAQNLAGIECLSGIPGKVGSAIVQNSGAFGQETYEHIDSVEVLDTMTLEKSILKKTDCEFGYRTSRFKNNPSKIVLSATFKLEDGFAAESENIWETRQRVLATRKERSSYYDSKDPNTISAGCFFKNPVVDKKLIDKLGAIPHWPQENKVKLAAGWLVEQAGFPKGYTYKNVGLSQKHSLIIINRGKGTAQQVLELADMIKKKVLQQFGVQLEEEPVLVGFTQPSLKQ